MAPVILACATVHAGQTETEIVSLLERYGQAFVDEDLQLISSLYLADDHDALAALNRTLSVLFDAAEIDDCSFAVRSIQLSTQGREALVLAKGRVEMSDPTSSDSIVDTNEMVIDLVNGPHGWRIRRMMRQSELELAERLRAGRRVGERLVATSGSDPDAGSRVRPTTGATPPAAVVPDRQPSAGNRSPSAAFAYMPPVPEVDETVVLVSTSSDPDGDEVSHAWSVDGPYAEDIDYLENRTDGEYEFDEAGEFTITLEVQDGRGGRDVAQRVITIAGEEELVYPDGVTQDEQPVYGDLPMMDEEEPTRVDDDVNVDAAEVVLAFSCMPEHPRVGDSIVVVVTSPVSDVAGLMLFWYVDEEYLPELDNERDWQLSGLSAGVHKLELEWFRDYEPAGRVARDISVQVE